MLKTKDENGEDILIEVIPVGKMFTHLKELGYNITYLKPIKIKIEELNHNSTKKVPCICDYCGKEFEIIFRTYCESHENDTDEEKAKDPCKNCTVKKARESYEKKTGYKYPAQNLEVQKKKEKTFLKHYGTTNYFNSNECKEKLDSYLKEHGVTNNMQIPEVLEKVQNTCLERYGVITNLIMEEGKEERREKRNISLNKNQTVSTSKNQKKICEIVGGELNKVFGRYNVDIYYKDNIYIEYNGSGHNLSVQKGKMTEKEFIQSEAIRYSYLKKDYNLKEIVFVNPKERKIPSNDIILKLVDYAYNFLQNPENN